MDGDACVVHSDLALLSGTPVSVWARVPLRRLIDHLDRGHGLDEFPDAYPPVPHIRAVAALEAAHKALTARARPAAR
jgi:hypothetical protein